MTADIVIHGLEFEAEYNYSPACEEVRYDSNMTGTPACEEEVEVTEIIHIESNADLTNLLEDASFRDKCEKAVLTHMERETEALVLASIF